MKMTFSQTFESVKTDKTTFSRTFESVKTLNDDVWRIPIPKAELRCFCVNSCEVRRSSEGEPTEA